MTFPQVEAQRGNITEAKMAIMKDIYKTQDQNSTGLFKFLLNFQLFYFFICSTQYSPLSS